MLLLLLMTIKMTLMMMIRTVCDGPKSNLNGGLLPYLKTE